MWRLPLALTPYPCLRTPVSDTLYFGGGTPSLLTPADVASIIDGEPPLAGPGARRGDYAGSEPRVGRSRAAWKDFAQAGVNRLSFGVQSFRDEELKRLGRLHSADRARQAVDMARAAGFDNVSLDLMMWLPGPGRRSNGWSRSRRPFEWRPITCRSTFSRSIRTFR